MSDPAPQDRPRPATPCPNCGAVSTTPYCGQCGQRRDLSLSVRHWLVGVVQGLSAADGRLWRTARTLVARPGQLERDWARGRRQSFMSPTKVYLFGTALLFFVTAVVPSPGNVFGDFARGILQADGDASALEAEQVDNVAATATRWILMLGMVPALAGMTRAFHGRRGDHFACHLVASLHLHAVLFLGLAVVLLVLHALGLSRDPDLSSGVAAMVMFPLVSVYAVIQAWRIHGRRWFWTLPRTILVLASYLALFAVVAALLFVMVVKVD